MIQRRIAATLLAALAALALPLQPGQAQQSSGDDGVLLNRIVALVEGGVVLQSELDAQVELVTNQLRAQGTRPPPAAALRQQVLETLIVQELQMQRAQRIGIRVSDEELNTALQRVAERNGISLTELPAALTSQGIDYARYRQQMRREMIIDRLRQRDVVARIAVSEREIERWLREQDADKHDRTEYDISQILVALPADASPNAVEAAEARINEIHTRLLNGEDFAEIAVANSEGQQALAGGRLGWRRGNQLPRRFFETIRELETGAISDPVKSSSGYHIFRLNDTRGTEAKVVRLQTHCRHILLQPNEVMDDAAVRDRLDQLRERILAGESFEDIARLESEDPGSAPTGGDLGWTGRGDFVPEFEEQLARLEAGEISEPFRTPFGWHLVQVVARERRDTTEELRRRKAVDAIRASKQEQETELWLRRMRDEAWVEIRGG